MKVTKRRHKLIGNIKNMKNKKITRKTRSMGYINGSKGTKKMESMGYINNRKSRKRRNIRKSKKRRTIIKHRKSKKNAGGLEKQKEKLDEEIEELDKKIKRERDQKEEEKLQIKLDKLTAARDKIQDVINFKISTHKSMTKKRTLEELCEELFNKFKKKKDQHLTTLNKMLNEYRNIEAMANEEKAKLTHDATRTIFSVINKQLANVINKLRIADSDMLPRPVPAVPITDKDKQFFNLTPTKGNTARWASTTTRRNSEYTNFMREMYLNGYIMDTLLDFNKKVDADFYYELIDRIDEEPDFSKLKTYLETYIPRKIPDGVRITHEHKGTEDPYHIFKFYGPGYVDDDDDLFHLTIHTTKGVITTDYIDEFNGGKIHLKKSVRDSAGKYVTQYETCTNLRPYIFKKITGLDRDLIGPNRCLQFIPIYPKHDADYATLADKLKLVIVKGVNEFILKNQIDHEAREDLRVTAEEESITTKQGNAQEFFKNYINTISARSIIMLRRNLIHNHINDIKDNLEAFTKFITDEKELDRTLFEECLTKVRDSKFKDILDEINDLMLQVKTLINDVTIEEAFITTEIPTTGPSYDTIDGLNTDARDNYGDFLYGDFLTNLETFRKKALANSEQIVMEDKITPFNEHVTTLNDALVNLKPAAPAAAVVPAAPAAAVVPAAAAAVVPAAAAQSVDQTGQLSKNQQGKRPATLVVPAATGESSEDEEMEPGLALAISASRAEQEQRNRLAAAEAAAAAQAGPSAAAQAGPSAAAQAGPVVQTREEKKAREKAEKEAKEEAERKELVEAAKEARAEAAKAAKAAKAKAKAALVASEAALPEQERRRRQAIGDTEAAEREAAQKRAWKKGYTTKKGGHGKRLNKITRKKIK